MRTHNEKRRKMGKWQQEKNTQHGRLTPAELTIVQDDIRHVAVAHNPTMTLGEYTDQPRNKAVWPAVNALIDAHDNCRGTKSDVDDLFAVLSANGDLGPWTARRAAEAINGAIVAALKSVRPKGAGVA